MWNVMHVEGWKSHIVSNDLLGSLEDEVAVIDKEIVDIEQINTVCLDSPGMTMADRSIQTINLDDQLWIEIPSIDFSHVFEQIKSSEMRTFPDGKKYFKIHSRFFCLILAPEQKDSVLHNMLRISKAVAVVAEIEEQEFASRITKINTESSCILSSRVDKHIKSLPLSGKPNKENN